MARNASALKISATPQTARNGPISLARKIDRCMSLSLRRHDPDQVRRVTLRYLSPGRARAPLGTGLMWTHPGAGSMGECRARGGGAHGIDFRRRHWLRQENAPGGAG